MEYNLIDILVPFLIATNTTFVVLIVFGVFLMDLKVRTVVKNLERIVKILEAQAEKDGVSLDSTKK